MRYILIILIFISCKKNENFTKSIILQENNDDYSYQIIKYNSKVNANNIDQCEKFLEYKSDENGYQIHGASIADLYSFFYNIKKYNINLISKDAIFYSIYFNGINDSIVNKNIFDKLLKLRKLEVININKELPVYVLSRELNPKNLSYSTNQLETHIKISEGKLELQNCSINLLAERLSDMYNVKIISSNSTDEKYDFTVPINREVKETFKYLQSKYQIRIKKENQLVKISQIQ